MQRNKCDRGCPFGAYFSSLSATLPAANATGHLYIRPESIVQSIVFDEGSQKAKGVVVIDRKTKKEMEFHADVIFVCASALASTKILLNSTSNRFPNGLGNDSGELGHNLMDHHYHVGAVAQYEGMENERHDGSRPNGIFIPRYANTSGISKKSFLRGWDYQGHAYKEGWGRGNNGGGVGVALKKNLEADGPWVLQLMGFGETLPYHENKMFLSQDQKDEWGIPLIIFDATLKDNEIAMRKQMKDDAAEMLQASGFKEVFPFDHAGGLGNCIHEMGTARMGRDPKTSVLNGFNQMHAVKNVFVTDGAFMTSSNCVNPSLTYMAFTARAADYAFSELKRGNL
jgi:choline dehydrogenase-like flavoprotein